MSPGEPLHLVTADRHRLLDWAAARRGRTLYGTPATDAIPVVPTSVVRQVVDEHLRSWPRWFGESDRAGAQAYAVLTVSRAAADLASGVPHSKRAGAVWATEHFLHGFLARSAARTWTWRP